MNFLANNGIFRNFWFSSATPTFLLKLIEQKHYYIPNFESITADDGILEGFDIDTIELETLMWQSGYLTIDSVQRLGTRQLYRLKLPNLEVRISLHDHILGYLAKAASRAGAK